MNRIHAFCSHSFKVQKETLKRLISEAKDTEIGKKYNFTSIYNLSDFQNKVPLVTYEDIEFDIKRMKRGESNILWSTPVEFFSKSSGTTGSRSKFLPVSYEALQGCHYRGGKDMLALYLTQFPDSKLFFGKTLGLGGSLEKDKDSDVVSGDVSAVIMSNLPVWAKILKTPPQEVALLSDWEEKSQKIVEIIAKEDLRALAGAPAWVLAILKQVQTFTGVDRLIDLWPNLEVFFYGSTSIKPFQKEFEEVIGSPIAYMGIYNASEGFFGIQDDVTTDGELLLMLDYDVVYEFLSFPNKQDEKPVFVDGLEIGKVYELIITTSAGLWRYRIGDLVKITSLNPIRIEIVGRTKQFINVFGEELMVHNAEDALRTVCQKHDCTVAEFTVAPIFQSKQSKGRHEWFVEFAQEPEDLDVFSSDLDQALRECNSDYDAKRDDSMQILQPLRLRSLPQGTFDSWMKSRNKLGGQNKVPRLSNDRQYADAIVKYLAND